VAGVGTVRLIGVDTPETVDPRAPVQFFGKEASEFTRRMAEGKVVRLEFDVQRTDKYERTLSYVYLSDGTFLNAEIVKQGYGHAYVKYPFKYLDQFRGYEREAREGRRGLWADPPSVAEQKAPSTEPARVWVNTASKVYHCPGTRYYGNTSRGTYMTEGEAARQGHRPAGGRSCGSSSTATAAAVPSLTGRVTTQTEASDAPRAGDPATRVWVNTSSRVYHCPGTRYYGATKNGQHMRQDEAQAAGYRPASGKYCSAPGQT
jgi:micrococcal nuclease